MHRIFCVIALVWVLMGVSGCGLVDQWGDNTRTEWGARERIAADDNNTQREIAQIEGNTAMQAAAQQTVQTSIVWSAMPIIAATLAGFACIGIGVWWFGRTTNDLVKGNLQLRLEMTKAYAALPAPQPQPQPQPSLPVAQPVPRIVRNYAERLGLKYDARYECEDGKWFVIDPNDDTWYEAPPIRNSARLLTASWQQEQYPLATR